MLARALLRRVWRRGPSPPASLCGAQAVKASSLLSPRCFSSALSEERGAEGSSGEEAAKTATSQQTKQHPRTAAWEEKILAALRAYKEMNETTLVPRSFIVPSDDARWPRVAWGYGLGKAVNTLRTRAARQELSLRMQTALKELSFTSSAVQCQWDEVILPALRHFYTVNGHTDVRKAFVVPDGDDAWPRRSWNWALGFTVQRIRGHNGYARQVEQSKEELKEMKFCFETSLAERNWNEKILPALMVYRKIHHHCIVERAFKVPREFPWPEGTWDLLLGQTVHKLRSDKSYAEFAARDEEILNAIGFAWDRNASTWKERIIPALQTYVAEFSTCRVPSTFVVPAGEPWPKSAWNTPLGMQVYHMSQSGCFFSFIGREVDRLKDLGFSFELGRRAWEKRVAPLLEIYETTFCDRAVPHGFVVPSEAPWPENMWGVHLGLFVASNVWGERGERRHITN